MSFARFEYTKKIQILIKGRKLAKREVNVPTFLAISGSAMKTIILADAEDKIAAKNVEAFRVRLTNTINVCIGNLEGQQVYIDNWRHLAKSGLLTVPD